MDAKKFCLSTGISEEDLSSISMEMIEAGVNAFNSLEDSLLGPELVVFRVFQAMDRQRICHNFLIDDQRQYRGSEAKSKS